MKVFEKKSELFNNFIEELWKVWEDRNITLEELSHLLKLVSKDIIPYTKPESAKSILNSLNAIASEVNTQENTANKKHMQTHIYAIINTLSDEIGLGGTIQQDIATELDKLEDSILPYLDKKRYMNKINELVQEKPQKAPKMEGFFCYFTYNKGFFIFSETLFYLFFSVFVIPKRYPFFR